MKIIKTISDYQKEASRNVEIGKNAELNAGKFRALSEILNYIFRLSYIQKPHLRQKVYEYLDCDKKKRSQRINSVANQFNCTARSVEILIADANRIVEEIAGEGIRLIQDGNVSEGICHFRRNAYSFDVKKMLLPGVYKLLPMKDREESLKIDKCGLELLYLTMLLKDIVSKEINNLDKQKLAYLLYVMESPEADTDEKKKVYDFINNEAGLLKLIEAMTKLQSTK